ncbi:uncharacterized protein TEOVI_000272600 [Trypanosoma equiperdum]|uniref:Uncharacterized protein n=2 Tax=Trypanozoon TaxID=39700 RepID=Q384M0_TRYB2|nr:hypothetical protein Tb11.01.0550 [Trypanosoma brucei brucei TREU927]EAN79761.1 hypothetical protein Tb11.01.0550 [Trypanosoma brucei brucei TREU927]SCU71146.1 hypothetical protein, conserved [Trypanosoma equiperdum]
MRCVRVVCQRFVEFVTFCSGVVPPLALLGYPLPGSGCQKTHPTALSLKGARVGDADAGNADTWLSRAIPRNWAAFCVNLQARGVGLVTVGLSYGSPSVVVRQVLGWGCGGNELRLYGFCRSSVLCRVWGVSVPLSAFTPCSVDDSIFSLLRYRIFRACASRST